MKGIFRVLGLTLIIALFLSSIGLLIWQWSIKNVYSNQKQEISNFIDSAVEKHAKEGFLLPDIIFINTDSIDKNELSDSLTYEIKTYMRERFLKNNDKTFEDLDIQPFYVLPQKANKDGNYVLTGIQLNELKSHIDFLTKQVSLEVSNTKVEVGKDIDRLNTWMSIWIAVIGFLGIFVPIVINIDVIKNADEAKASAEDALSKSTNAKNHSNIAQSEANDALKKINNAKEEIQKIGQIEKQVNSIEPKISRAVLEAKTALLESKETKQGLAVIFSINNLNKIDPQLLMQLSGKDDKLKLITAVLTELNSALQKSEEYYSNDFTRDLLIQLIIKLRSISLFKFINASQTRNINDFASIVENALDKLDEVSFKKIIKSLEELITKLLESSSGHSSKK